MHDTTGAEFPTYLLVEILGGVDYVSPVIHCLPAGLDAQMRSLFVFALTLPQSYALALHLQLPTWSLIKTEGGLVRFVLMQGLGMVSSAPGFIHLRLIPFEGQWNTRSTPETPKHVPVSPARPLLPLELQQP